MKGSDIPMNDEFNNNQGCDPADCASCDGCGGGIAGYPGTIKLTLDDDTEMECTVLTIFPAGDKQYIALLPADVDDEDMESEVYIYSFALTPEGDPLLGNIEDDDEYELASQAFDTILENARTVAEADPE